MDRVSRLTARPPVVVVLIVLAAAVPRLAVLAAERSDVVLNTLIVEKNVRYARTFVDSGTFGQHPGIPSAATQPLYGFMLVPLYWLFDGSWLSIGLTQIALAVATALLIYAIARRLFDPRWALAAALIATLNPYLVWHDVHVGREVLDELIAAGMVLAALVAAERRSVALAAGLGAITGLAILSNVRLTLLPLLLAGFLVWRFRGGRRAIAAVAVLLAASALVVAPWVVRNRVSLGCYALTTNSQALWKANNARTYDALSRGAWIDDVPVVNPPRDTLRRKNGVLYFDECEEMRFYQRRVIDYWRDHPGEKARLAVQAAGMFWDPRARVYDVRAIAGGANVRPVSGPVDFARTWIQGAYMVAVFVLALLGLAQVRRDFALLAALLLAYQTVMAMIFAGTTRYRAPWDFLLVLLAVGALRLLFDPADRSRLTAPFARLRRRRAAATGAES